MGSGRSDESSERNGDITGVIFSCNSKFTVEKW